MELDIFEQFMGYTLTEVRLGNRVFDMNWGVIDVTWKIQQPIQVSGCYCPANN